MILMILNSEGSFRWCILPLPYLNFLTQSFQRLKSFHQIWRLATCYFDMVLVAALNHPHKTIDEPMSGQWNKTSNITYMLHLSLPEPRMNHLGRSFRHHCITITHHWTTLHRTVVNVWMKEWLKQNDPYAIRPMIQKNKELSCWGPEHTTKLNGLICTVLYSAQYAVRSMQYQHPIPSHKIR